MDPFGRILCLGFLSALAICLFLSDHWNRVGLGFTVLIALGFAMSMIPFRRLWDRIPKVLWEPGDKVRMGAFLAGGIGIAASVFLLFSLGLANPGGLGIAAFAGLIWLGCLVRMVIRRVRNRPTRYFVRWLTEDQKRSLTRASIPYTLQMDGSDEGIVFDAHYLNQVRTTLGAEVICRLRRGGYTMECEAVLHFPPVPEPALRKIKVELRGESTPYRRKVLKVARDLLVPRLRRDVVVHNDVHGPQAGGALCIRNPIENGKFHIFIFACPLLPRHAVYPGRLFGISTENASTNGWTPSGLGIPIIDKDSGFTVAELVGNCLYIHLNLLSAKTDTQVALLLRILQKTVEELSADEIVAKILSLQPADPAITIADPQPAAHCIFDEGFSGRRRQVVLGLTRQLLLPSVGSDVLVRDCGGNAQDPLRDGMFHVFLYSSPQGSKCVETPQRIWGCSLLKHGSSFAPSGRGIPIVDPDSGHIVAEIVERNLYVHQEIIPYGSQSEAALFARLLREAAREMAFERAVQDTTVDTMAVRYADECWKQVEACLKPGPGGYENANQVQKKFHDLLATVQVEERRLYELEAAPTEEFGREYDQLCTLAKVLKVQVTGSCLLVTTDVLYCVDPRTKRTHEIGAFNITIPLASGNPVWVNQTRKVDTPSRGGMNAPHVEGKGNGCLGNTEDVFPMLIRKRDYVSAVQLSIAFIESVNVNDHWGKYINMWPLAHGPANQ